VVNRGERARDRLEDADRLFMVRDALTASRGPPELVDLVTWISTIAPTPRVVARDVPVDARA
jgi:hypothetical protein